MGAGNKDILDLWRKVLLCKESLKLEGGETLEKGVRTFRRSDLKKRKNTYIPLRSGERKSMLADPGRAFRPMT